MEREVSNNGSLMTLLRIILALALLGSLIFAGARIYRRLPAEARSPAPEVVNEGQVKRLLTVSISNSLPNATLNSPIEIYPFDLVAARREFEASPRLAKQFDDFLVRRMHDISPLKANTHSRGDAVAVLNEGDWWLHAFASLDTGETIEWRLPVVIKDRNETIELSRENAYERTKKF